MKDFGILKDIFNKIKCHTAKLSLLNIRGIKELFPNFLWNYCLSQYFSDRAVTWVQIKAPFQRFRSQQNKVKGLLFASRKQGLASF